MDRPVHPDWSVMIRIAHVLRPKLTFPDKSAADRQRMTYHALIHQNFTEMLRESIDGRCRLQRLVRRLPHFAFREPPLVEFGVAPASLGAVGFQFRHHDVEKFGEDFSGPSYRCGFSLRSMRSLRPNPIAMSPAVEGPAKLLGRPHRPRTTTWPMGSGPHDCRFSIADRRLPIADSGQFALAECVLGPSQSPIANRQSLDASCGRGHLLTPAAYSCPG